MAAFHTALIGKVSPSSSVNSTGRISGAGLASGEIPPFHPLEAIEFYEKYGHSPPAHEFSVEIQQ
jgi:hypothetical protein